MGLDADPSTTEKILADSNYPTDYEWMVLIHGQQDDYNRKMVENLRAMLTKGRAEIERLRESVESYRRFLYGARGD